MYSGELIFEDREPIEVTSLIVRDTEAAFELVGWWGEHGRWKRSGIAFKHGLNFSSDFRPSYRVPTGIEGYNCKIIFYELARTDKRLTVRGSWIEEGEERDFSGFLQQKN
ncbi:hypothetical protein [Candidatus Methylomicrobium oryzae]|uniref:hypothetical protein n=1 Tax=Candidatus Methylomicrobium oryzae TaxID=2802053 RepID=UPI0019205FAF|nr:hypothetical protein [Methylomicrobium sp. RS1]MBL1265862.1 hypothetical protein [Methylomicrobium sp. RS1]